MRILQEVSNFAPDVVAISVLFSNLLESLQYCKIIKKINKNIKVVLGGNHISCAVKDYQAAILDKNSAYPKTLKI